MQERKEIGFKDKLRKLAIEAEHSTPLSVKEGVLGINTFTIAELATVNPTVTSCVLGAISLLLLDGVTVFNKRLFSPTNRKRSQ